MEAEKARRNLGAFVRAAWPVVEPGTDFIDNWHIGAICEHLAAVTAGQLQKLVINIPPGHMKSLIASVFWPAWEWIDAPHTRSLFSSYALDLALRDSVRCRDIVTSDWYRDAFDARWSIKDGHWRLKDDQNVKAYFENSKKGFRFSMSVGGRATGFRGQKIVVDDPLNAKEMHSKLAREECIFWWDKVMSSRLNDPRSGARVIIMQRLHEEDLTGHVLRAAGYEHLCLPSEFDPARKSITFLGKLGTPARRPFWEDPRTEKGALLNPILFNVEVLEQAKKDLDSDYEGQHNQQPSPEEGAILKKAWWKYYTKRPEVFDEIIISWDMTFKDTKGSDYVCGQVWGRVGANRYLLGQVWGKLDFTATCEAVVNLSEQWPQARVKLIEEKANGAAVINVLKGKISGLIPVNPTDSKEGRAWAAQPELKAGNYFLPALSLPDDPEGRPVLEQWVSDFITECANFPRAANDDRVDTFTQAAAYFAERKGTENVPNPFG